MEINYYGHSCFLIKVGGKKLLFDPFIRGNELAKEINIDSIEADYILVSHGHEDHTGDLVYLAKKTDATVIASFEITSWLQKQGINKVHPMNVGGNKNFEFGKVSMTYAAHSSSFADGTYAGVASGFVITAEGKSVYYSGDTGLTQEMKLIGEMHAISLALLPIGDNFTMDAKDAATAANFLNCKDVIGLHYDTFGFIVINNQEAINSFANKGVKLTLLKIGETFAA
ncbi:MAG: metal-dependent hydrolase [Bacteroidia bacterium]|nr:metal-dependent hydrolase [Bacteroidia bacterium]MCF8427494.1 metal-dependent hydrolase [Bacteroidia bacterium]MCF8447923.1 metal-dependent hydrolase [Bacteroidia bacterium]